MRPKEAVDDKLDLLNKSPATFVAAMQGLARAVIEDDRQDEKQKTLALAKLLGDTMMLADLLGRKRFLMEFDHLSKKRQPARFHHGLGIQRFAATPIFPKIKFIEAIKDLLGREPRLVKNMDDVARAYSGENGFAILKLPWKLANRARLKLTAKIRNKLADFISGGEPRPSVKTQLQAMGNFSSSYAENVYRTNLATAFTAGRMKQADTPEFKDVTPAFEFTDVGDRDTTEWCRSTSGLLAATGDSAWKRYAPPLHWQCRSDLRLVDRKELADRGLLRSISLHPYYPPNIAKGGPAPGFRHSGAAALRLLEISTVTEVCDLRPWMIYAENL